MDSWRTALMYRSDNIRATLAVAAVVVIGCGQPSGVPTGGAGQSTSPSHASPPVAPSAEPPVATTAAKSAAAPQPPIEFTGRTACGPPVSPDREGREEAVDVGDDGMLLTRFRGGAWHQTLRMSDPRLEGAVYHTYESDRYTNPGAEQGPLVWAATFRIENEAGAWVSRGVGGSYSDGTSIGNPTEVFIGEGAYEGMIAIIESSPLEHTCGSDIRGVLFGDGPVPEPYNPR
jgi:hypothetical protein